MIMIISFFFLSLSFFFYFLVASPLSLLSLHFNLTFSSLDFFSLFLHLANPSPYLHLPCPAPIHLFLHLPSTQATALLFSLSFFFSFFLHSSLAQLPCPNTDPSFFLHLPPTQANPFLPPSLTHPCGVKLES